MQVFRKENYRIGKVLLTTLIAFLILFVYELPFSLKIVDNIVFLEKPVEEIRLEMEKTDYYDYKLKERDFWSEVKGSEIERLDFGKSEGLVEEVTAVEGLEEDESCVLDVEGLSLTQEELVFLEKLREERRLEQERLERESKIHLPAKILVVGDSLMMENLGSAIEKDLKNIDGLSVVKSAKYSTGLNRRDYYDWHTTTQKLIEEHKPEALVVSFGANDGQKISPIGGYSRYDFGTAEWKDTYRKRVNSYFTMNTPDIKKMYFIGQPNSLNHSFAVKFETINQIIEEEASKFEKVEYINTWDKFTIDGSAVSVLADETGKTGYVKFSDGIHLTDHGSGIVSEMVVERLGGDILRE